MNQSNPNGCRNAPQPVVRNKNDDVMVFHGNVVQGIDLGKKDDDATKNNSLLTKTPAKKKKKSKLQSAKAFGRSPGEDEDDGMRRQRMDENLPSTSATTATTTATTKTTPAGQSTQSVQKLWRQSLRPVSAPRATAAADAPLPNKNIAKTEAKPQAPAPSPPPSLPAVPQGFVSAHIERVSKILPKNRHATTLHLLHTDLTESISDNDNDSPRRRRSAQPVREAAANGREIGLQGNSKADVRQLEDLPRSNERNCVTPTPSESSSSSRDFPTTPQTPLSSSPWSVELRPTPRKWARDSGDFASHNNMPYQRTLYHQDDDDEEEEGEEEIEFNYMNSHNGNKLQRLFASDSRSQQSRSQLSSESSRSETPERRRGRLPSTLRTNSQESWSTALRSTPSRDSSLLDDKKNSRRQSFLSYGEEVIYFGASDDDTDNDEQFAQYYQQPAQEARREQRSSRQKQAADDDQEESELLRVLMKEESCELLQRYSEICQSRARLLQLMEYELEHPPTHRKDTKYLHSNISQQLQNLQQETKKERLMMQSTLEEFRQAFVVLEQQASSAFLDDETATALRAATEMQQLLATAAGGVA